MCGKRPGVEQQIRLAPHECDCSACWLLLLWCAQVSCANYEARVFGVRAGMFISEAKRLCPDMVVVPYLFDRYQEISEQVGT